ncbi:MAG: amidohydrolase family protein [Gammaproteobacteria bacterium]
MNRVTSLRRTVAVIGTIAQIVVAIALTQSAVHADTLIRGARVHTVTSKGTLEKADVLVRGGSIAAVGTNINVPAGVTVVDAAGRDLTPGLFGGLSQIGLQEVSGEPATDDSSVTDTMPLHDMQLRPEFDPTPQFNPRSVEVPVARIAGITWTMLTPGRPPRGGGTFLTGQASAVTLDGRFDAVLSGSRTLFVDLQRDATAIAGGSRATQFMLLDQALRETRTPGSPSADELLHPAGRDALKRYLAGGRVVFQVDRAVDIRQAVAFAQLNGMKPVIVGGAEAWVVANDLAKARVPVVLDPLVNLPANFDKIGARLDNAALLNRAGVRIAFMLNEDQTTRAKRIRQVAGNAAANGLPSEVALAAITANPAEIFGLGASRGRIAVGQAADLVLWTGDPLEVTTAAQQVWIAGRAVEMTSRQTELRDRYLEKLRNRQAR